MVINLPLLLAAVAVAWVLFFFLRSSAAALIRERQARESFTNMPLDDALKLLSERDKWAAGGSLAVALILSTLLLLKLLGLK